MPKIVDHWPLKIKPRDVQRLAFNKGRERDKFGYYLEQGLGKTLLDYADFYSYVYADRVDHHAIVAPSYLVSNWETENEEYKLEFPVVTWPDEPTERQLRRPLTWVFNTEAVGIEGRQGNRALREFLAKYRCMMTVDETVCIANHTSQVSKRVIDLGYAAPIHRALSGLPAPERVSQWWAQLRFLGEMNGWTATAFRNRYSKMGGYMNKQEVDFKEEHREELQAIIDSVSIRALKDDWLDIPKKIYSPPLTFGLSGRQKSLYMQMLNDFYLEVAAAPDGMISADQTIHQLMKLQQISRGFVMQDGVAYELVPPEMNPALQVLRQALRQVEGKVLIFAFYEHSVRTLFEQCTKWGRTCMVLRGGLSKEEIRERKAYFNEDPTCDTAILQFTVGAKGHTLLGRPGPRTRCRTTIYYENLYGRDPRSQSEDRNHRDGQDSPVSYLDLVEDVPSSPTRKTLKALIHKQNFVDATLNSLRTRRPT